MKLRQLLDGTQPQASLSPISLSIGEPQHAPPPAVLKQMVRDLKENSELMGKYPISLGMPELRNTIAQWLTQRFHLNTVKLDPETQILPVNGTREALFAIAQTVIDDSKPSPLVLMPNPFYQIYEGGALLAGAEPYFLNCIANTDYAPDYHAVPAEVWKRCQLLYLCSPGNPTGTVTDLDTYRYLFELADRYDFVIASDECYSELYFDEENPPLGLLEACEHLGRHQANRCIVFHSLSKRSNLPGLRSGFVAGDPSIMRAFLQYRTYHGCAMPLHTQKASIVAWQDEEHVKHNRELYRKKFDCVLNILSPVLPVEKPQAGFYLWPEVPGTDESFTRSLYEQQNVLVLPGSYLARDSHNNNPGSKRVRMALVATIEQCELAANRVRQFIENDCH